MKSKTRMIKYMLNICWKCSEVCHLLHLNIKANSSATNTMTSLHSCIY